MKVLIDECLPKRVARELTGHHARTVSQTGWSGRKNGLLLRNMIEAGFEVVLTIDKSLPFQQNLTSLGVALVILRVRSNRCPAVGPLIPSLQLSLRTISRGDIIRPGPPDHFAL